MLVENYSNSRSLQTLSAAEAIFSDLRVNKLTQTRRGPPQKKRLGVPTPFRAQRFLHSTQARGPATAHAERFSLLCFQPEALLVSTAARTPVPTPRRPCRARARPGRAISAACRTWTRQQRFANLTPARVTEGRDASRLGLRAAWCAGSGIRQLRKTHGGARRAGRSSSMRFPGQPIEKKAACVRTAQLSFQDA